MKAKDTKFIKLSFNKKLGTPTLETSRELLPLTKEEVRRIKRKAQQRLIKH